MISSLLATTAHAPAAAIAGGGVGSGVTLMIVGMGVVFTALTVILLVITLLNRVLRERSEPAVAAAPIKPDAGPAPETVAVLAAAATAATGKLIRVRRITMLGASGRGSDRAAWVAGGRASLMGSHRPQRPKR